MNKKPTAHLQVGGELPYAVVSTRQQFEDSSVEIVAVYGPVPTKEDAEELAAVLKEMGIGEANEDALHIVVAYPVRPVEVTELPVEIDLEDMR